MELNFERAFLLDFDLSSGLSQSIPSTKRMLSQMKDMYCDRDAADALIKSGDPLVYEFYSLPAPEHPGDLSFGTSITYPGRVGNEYYMTKGHFHSILDTAEVYYALSGQGMMLMESPEGDVDLKPLKPGVALYVPKRYAHRTVNVGSVPFVSFFVYRADAGHDYGTIETKGFRKLVVRGEDGEPTLIDNPKWREIL